MQKPNFTQIPNEIIDEWMCQLSGSEFKVLITIARKTFGWQKKKDLISIGQIGELTGLSRRQIIDSTKSLGEKDLISIDKNEHYPSFFEIKVDDEKNAHIESGAKNAPDGAKTAPQLVQKLHKSGAKNAPTKETNKRNVKKFLQKKASIPRSLDEVAVYVYEKNLKVDPRAFYNYFEAGDWHDSNGRQVRSWKQKILTWNKFEKYDTEIRKQTDEERLAEMRAMIR